MEAPLQLTALGAPIDLVTGGSRGQEARAALAERWSLCARSEPSSDARRIEVRFGDEEAATTPARVEVPTVAGAELDRLLVDVTHHVTWQAIDAGAGSLVMFHAAAVADLVTGAAVVCVAPGGTGKTTLCRALGVGRAYLSDETVAIGQDRSILAYPKPLSVRRGDGGPMAAKDEVAPGDHGLTAASVPSRPAAVLLLAREPDGPDEPEVEELDLFDAIVALTPETSSLARLPQPLHRLAELLESLSLLARVRYRESSSLEALVAGLIGPTVAR